MGTFSERFSDALRPPRTAERGGTTIAVMVLIEKHRDATNDEWDLWVFSKAFAMHTWNDEQPGEATEDMHRAFWFDGFMDCV